MIRVGLTGGIGAGKSFVAEMFSILNVPIFYSDLAAKYIMIGYPKVKSQIIELLGEESYLPNGNLNKKHIGSSIFENDIKRTQLNQIVHPAVAKAGQEWFQEQSGPYALYESALIFEAGHLEHFDKIISVSASEETRIERVIKRDKISKEQVLKRLDKQWSQKIKDEKSDFVIINDHGHSLIKQVLKLHKVLSSKT